MSYCVGRASLRVRLTMCVTSSVMLGMLFFNVTSGIFRTSCVIYLYRQCSVYFGWIGIGNLPFVAALTVCN